MPKSLHLMVLVWMVAGAVRAAEPPMGLLDYLGENVRKSEVILVTRADLDGDGVGEWFFSAPRQRNGKFGNIWLAFRETPEGLKAIPGDCVFHTQSHLVGDEGELKRGIYSVRPAGGGEMSIVRIHLSGGQIQSEEVAKGLHSQDGAEGYEEPWRSIFARPELEAEEIPPSDIYQRFPLLEKVVTVTSSKSTAGSRASSLTVSASASVPIPSATVTKTLRVPLRAILLVSLMVLGLAIALALFRRGSPSR